MASGGRSRAAEYYKRAHQTEKRATRPPMPDLTISRSDLRGEYTLGSD